MKRRYFIGSTGILSAGLFNLNLFSPTKELPNSIQNLMSKFNKELKFSLSEHNAPSGNIQITKVRKVLAHGSMKHQSYFYYESKSNDRVLLLKKGERDWILINPINPEKHFALA